MPNSEGVKVECQCGYHHTLDDWDEGIWKSICPKCKEEYTFETETVKNIKVLNEKGEVVKTYTFKKPASKNKIY